MKSKNPARVAKQEVFEEAGLVGEIIGKRPLGSYYYSKKLNKMDVLTEVLVYSFRVEKQAEDRLREIAARNAMVRRDRRRRARR